MEPARRVGGVYGGAAHADNRRSFGAKLKAGFCVPSSSSCVAKELKSKLRSSWILSSKMRQARCKGGAHDVCAEAWRPHLWTTPSGGSHSRQRPPPASQRSSKQRGGHCGNCPLRSGQRDARMEKTRAAQKCWLDFRVSAPQKIRLQRPPRPSQIGSKQSYGHYGHCPLR